MVVNGDTIWIYIGTHTHRPGQGIYRCDFDLAKGKIAYAELTNDDAHSELFSRSLATESIRPSFLAFHPHRPLLFCVHEIRDYNQRESGAVSAYAIEPETGRLKLLNCRASLGPTPCHLAVDSTGNCLLVANYAAGSVVCFPILPDGSLDEASSFFQHHGSSLHQTRQTGPHAHGITLDPTGCFVFVPDLGMDKVVAYRLDSENALLSPYEPLSADITRGAGPRHIVFSQNARFAYVINELSSTLSVFRYDTCRDKLEPYGEISILPAEYDGKTTAAEICLHPSGRFLYCSNRGRDSIAVFQINAESGMPTARGHQSTLGKCPRHFCITPGGEYLLASNQVSDNISVFRIDTASGKLAPLSSSLTFPHPVCLLPTQAY